MNAVEKALLAAVDAERIKKLTLDLVAIPSPTGQSRQAAEAYARYLRGIGLDVEVFSDFAESPSVVARLKGASGGKTLQLAGHIDTIPIAHGTPYYADGLIYGRGAADMKGGLAAMAEAAHVLHEGGVRLGGDVLLTAFGLHEAPAGHGEGLSALVKRGIVGDAAIVCEGAARDLPIAGKGMGIFEFTVTRPGESVHELQASPETAHPIVFAARLVARLQEKAAELARAPLPDVGPESIFLGIIQSGDFYNRVPISARLVGTRRHGPDKSFADTRQELEAIARAVEAEDPTGQIVVRVSLMPVRESFRLHADEPIVKLVQSAYEELTGLPLPLVGISMVADAPILIREGHIPAVYHGPWSDRAHSDVEYIALDELVRAARLYILCALRFCGQTE